MEIHILPVLLFLNNYLLMKRERKLHIPGESLQSNIRREKLM